MGRHSRRSQRHRLPLRDLAPLLAAAERALFLPMDGPRESLPLAGVGGHTLLREACEVGASEVPGTAREW